MKQMFRLIETTTKVALLTAVLCLPSYKMEAQLDENCTVSVLNRNVPVNPDGTWVLSNIPANFGRVRARANCIQNGITVTGESDLFLVPPNGSVTLIPITLGSSTPIPTALSLTAPITQLTSAGGTVQVQAIASYPSDPDKDVTAANTGTDYTISNPAIATISPDGLVTAVSSGTVVIQATNDGASGILSIQVALGGASHGGIPDTWAIAHGLDPNDPAMPFEDPDHDGLTNLEEFQNGTDPHNPDTDGDGLTDGDEVHIYHTNPLLPDTDGDGIPDGVEIQTGTDPLDPNSYDLNKAVQSLTIQPSVFALTVNSILGEASVQLSVTGHLIDGKTNINLTATAPPKRATNYSSSNLSICNFGSPDGNVFAGSNGSCTITANNNGHSAAAQGTVTAFAPEPLSSINIPGFANGVAVNGNFAYVAAGSKGLQIVDVTDRTSPQIVASLATSGNANDIRLMGTQAFLADDAAGIAIVDISHPLTPSLIGTYKTVAPALDIAVSAGLAYVAEGTAGVEVVNVANPATPQGVSSLSLTGTTKGVDIDSARNLLVAVGTAGLFAISVANPNSPALVGSLNYASSVGVPIDARDVALQGNTALVADFASSLVSIDLSNPALPTYLASAGVGAFVELQDVTISGNFAFGADAKPLGGVPIFNVSNPSVLQSLSTLTFPAGDSRGFQEIHATGIAVDGAYAYLTASHSVMDLQQKGVSGDTGLFIGRYQPPVDTNGIPPTAQIVAPANGTAVVRGSQLQILVRASDDVAVAAVNIFVNGQQVFTATSAPYQFTYFVPPSATTLQIGAQAIDFGQNVGNAAPITVIAINDPLTTSQGTIVDRSNTPVAGASVNCQGIGAVSAPDGSFSVSGLSTILGPIQCAASATISGIPEAGISGGFTPVPGGITAMGAIILSNLGSQGTDFWLAFPNSLGSVAEVFILTNGSANYTVTNTSTAFSASGTATPQSPGIVFLLPTLMVSTSQTVENKGIHVTADSDVSVFLYSLAPSDIYLGIPTPTLGSEFFALDYTGIGPGFLSRLTVAASQNGTQIAFSNACGGSVSTTLNAGQTYAISCADVSGAHVVSSQPILAVTSNDCGVPSGLNLVSCGGLAQNMFPVGPLWGTEIYSAPLPGDPTGFDIYRVIASRDGTTVRVDQGGGDVQTLALNQGQFQELHFKSGAHFTSNLPILVMQYSTGFTSGGVGQFSAMQLLPVSSFQSSSTFYAPADLGWANYALIIAPSSAVASVQLNGKAISGFSALPGGVYEYAIVNVPNGQSNVTSAQPIAVYSLGFLPVQSYSTPTRF